VFDIEEIEELNPPSGRVIASLIGRGFVSAQLLCETASELTTRGAPLTYCFTQLPYPIAVSSQERFVVSAGTKGVHCELQFQPVFITVDKSNALQVEFADIEGRNSIGAVGTQVRGFISLWGRHTAYYQNYQECLGEHGLKDIVINPALWNRKRAPAYYTGNVITSHGFEKHMAKHLMSVFKFSLNRFLTNYSLAALEEIPTREELSSYFLMLAPGRVVTLENINGMVVELLRKTASRKLIPASLVRSALRWGIREIDEFLHQILAMQKLAEQNEPELAVIGCASAVEALLNKQLGQNNSLMLNRCIDHPQFRFISDELRQKLHGIRKLRNDIVHGKMPNRKQAKWSRLPAGTVQSTIETCCCYIARSTCVSRTEYSRATPNAHICRRIRRERR
jgi:Domain of unknown function (DUF4145)